MREEQRRSHKQHHKNPGADGSIGTLLDTCSHYFAHRVGGSRRGRGKVMELIADKPGITQKELTQQLGVQPASLSEILMKLERKGFVEREKDDSDRRVVKVRLTAEGQAELAKPQEQEDPFQVLSAEEQETLKNLLSKLIADWEERYPHERGHKHGDRQADHHEDGSSEKRQGRNCADCPKGQSGECDGTRCSRGRREKRTDAAGL